MTLLDRSLPSFARGFVVDFAATALAVIFGLNLVIPSTLDEAKAQAAIVGVAMIGAFINSARRSSPAFIEWLKAQLGD